MPASKTNIISYSLLAVTGLLAIYFIIKTQQLSAELNQVNEQIQSIEKTYAFNQPKNLESIDSLLLTGRYSEAIRAYQKQLNQAEEADFERALQIRINLAGQLLKSALRQIEEKDSSSTAQIVTAPLITQEDVRQFDSLNFVLDKANIRINYLERQLKENTSGAYLTFSTSKGRQAHYVGRVKDKMANGRGVALLSSGSRYEGEWKNNLRHGEGTFYWPDGEYYTGEYKSDKRHGLGTYHWPNGERFTGLWENDQRNGQGTFYGEKGEIRGTWKDDELVKVQKK